MTGVWSRDIAEQWVDDADRLAFHPATPPEVRDVLLKYVNGTRQSFRLADAMSAATAPSPSDTSSWPFSAEHAP